MEIDAATANSRAPINSSNSRRGSQVKTPTESKPSTQSGSTKDDDAKSGKPKEGAVSQAGGETKLSNAELKKRAKEEKAARRAKEKEARQAEQDVPPTAAAPIAKGHERRKSIHAEQQGPPTPKPQPNQHHQRKGSITAQAQKQLPIHSKEPLPANTFSPLKPDNRKVALFSHLYGPPRRTTIANPPSKDVHPAILALGLQFSSYTLCGSNVRLLSTLLAFKNVIQAYFTPVGQSLPRHLPQHLSSQIEYLTSCRPLSISMGNAIRWLKLKISEIDPDTEEDVAKTDLREDIDNFINERVILADQLIADFTCSKIQDQGDVILTYGKSTTVQKTLHEAHFRGKKFSVIVVDSRPLFEGRNLARALVRLGIKVQYTLTHAINHVIHRATKVLLGAHAMMSNGRLYSRVGTALVAMMAKETSIPVIVCCESIKFTDRVALDSIVHNEVAPSEELLLPREKGGQDSKDKGGGAEAEAGIEHAPPRYALNNWKDIPNLQLLNLMYDLTPAEYISVVITEYGFLPPSSVPVVHRLSVAQGA